MNKQRVMDALTKVMDPEYPVSIVDLGLVQDVSVDGNRVTVKLTFTSTGCPCTEWIIDDVKKTLSNEEGVEEVEVETVWNKPWTVDDMTEEAKEQLKKYFTAM